MGLLDIFASVPLDCKKTPLLSIKVHLILDRYDIIHLQKIGGLQYPALACLIRSKSSHEAPSKIGIVNSSRDCFLLKMAALKLSPVK